MFCLVYVCSAAEGRRGFKKQGSFETPRYTDTQLDEVFAAKKSRFRVASGKENAKVIIFSQLLTNISLLY